MSLRDVLSAHAFIARADLSMSRTPIRKPPPPRQRFANPLAGLAYAKCTEQTLRDSIEGRRGSFSNHGNRRYLIGRLRGLDEEWSFRLMDLPPEIRNMVYCELLKPDSKTDRPTNLNILLVSKQIHHETEQILYDLNPITIEFTSPTRTLLNGKALPYPAYRRRRRGHIEKVAPEYARYPKDTCLKIQHLKVNIDNDVDMYDDRSYNRRLLVVANLFGGSSALKTVEVRVSDRTKYLYGPSPWDMDDMEHMLYPLTKLASTDVAGTTRNRSIIFHGEHRRVQRRLERRVAAGTPRPVDAIGDVMDMQRRAQEINVSIAKLPVDKEFDEEFDVFFLALDAVANDGILQDVVDYDKDVLFCRKVESLKAVFERHEKRWKKRKLGNMWELMYGAQGGIHWESTGDAKKWLEEQGDRFEDWIEEQRKRSEVWQFGENPWLW